MNWTASTTANEIAEGHSLAGKRVVITGASAGIGAETARVLAGIGAQLVLAVRDPAACDELANQIVDAGGLAPQVERLDLADLTSVRACAARIVDRPINLLINNAGVMATPFGKTVDGFETQFGVDHLGHFLLTALLVPALRIGAPARVVILSSAAHVWSDIDLGDPNYEHRDYDRWLAYGAAKTANVLHAVELTRRYGAEGICANAVMPGRVSATRLSRHTSTESYAGLPEIASAPVVDEDPAAGQVKTLNQGAATTVWAALAPELEGKGGLYLEDTCVARPWSETNPRRGVRSYALDPDRAEKLWEISERLVGL